MRDLVRSEVVVEAPARAVWDYVTDWSRQGEWIPFTRVETVPRGTPAGAVGDRVRARTGLGPVGVWDPMTITGWEVAEDGSARCEVLHTGRVVRGEAELSVVAEGPQRCRFVWWERLTVPGGVLGALLWRLVGPVMRRGVDHALRRLARRAEHEAARG
jgi:hypothetical protein